MVESKNTKKYIKFTMSGEDINQPNFMVGRKMLPPPPMCFSCGRQIPEHDYDIYRERTHTDKENPRYVLDDMNYPLKCCRRMFIGDAYEARRLGGLYDYSTLNESPHL